MIAIVMVMVMGVILTITDIALIIHSIHTIK
jgi:hypothetical protein